MLKKTSDFNNGDIVFININNQQSLKRIYRLNGSIVLKAENSKIGPLVFMNEAIYTNFNLIGKVVMVHYKL